MNMILADTYEWLKTAQEGMVDHVITDFEYGTYFPFEELKRVVKGNIITFCSEKDHPFDPDERAYWIKTPSTKNYSKHLGRFVEHIYIHRGENSVFNAGLHWSQYTGVYTDLVEEPNGHQWQKPASLMERLVKIYTRKGETVLDPFCGSGQTLKACKKLGRGYIGIDIDPKWIQYCEENL